MLNKKNSRNTFPAFLTAFLLLSGPNLYAVESFVDESAQQPQGRMGTALDKIEKRLAAIEETQREILEGQKKLSEEHTQLRYWIHKR